MWPLPMTPMRMWADYGAPRPGERWDHRAVSGGARCLAVVALVGAALTAGCGGGDDAKHGAARTTTTTPRQAPPPAGARAADSASVRVIRGWVDAERRGDVAG